VRVLTYNIHGWRALDGAFNLDTLAEVIAQARADLVGLNEALHPHQTSDGTSLSLLAKRLGMSYAFAPALASGASPSSVPYGNALLSRWKVLAYAVHTLPSPGEAELRCLLEARIALPTGLNLGVYVIHLDNRSEQVRLTQWAAASTWLARDRARPHLLMGDFNTLSASDYGDPASLAALAAHNLSMGWLPPEFAVSERVRKAGYADASVLAGGRPAPTWPAGNPERRIDYIFLPHAWSGALQGCNRFDSAAALRASDHLPVLAEFDPGAALELPAGGREA
jgi:endonuclease/exonuclease/phosphatase family metal-dependent hydrolase